MQTSNDMTNCRIKNNLQQLIRDNILNTTLRERVISLLPMPAIQQQSLKPIANFNYTITFVNPVSAQHTARHHLRFKNQFSIHVIKSELLLSSKNSLRRRISSKSVNGIYNLPSRFNNDHITERSNQRVFHQQLKSITYKKLVIVASFPSHRQKSLYS